jgi:hypothetical protein
MGRGHAMLARPRAGERGVLATISKRSLLSDYATKSGDYAGGGAFSCVANIGLPPECRLGGEMAQRVLFKLSTTFAADWP